MFAVKLLRKVGALEEEYGRVVFDGRNLSYDGLSSFFVKQLQKGVTGPDSRRYRPEHGVEFLRNLKHHFASYGLSVSEVYQCSSRQEGISSSPMV
jgi:hypothetical protein